MTMTTVITMNGGGDEEIGGSGRRLRRRKMMMVEDEEKNGNGIRALLRSNLYPEIRENPKEMEKTPKRSWRRRREESRKRRTCWVLFQGRPELSEGDLEEGEVEVCHQNSLRSVMDERKIDDVGTCTPSPSSFRSSPSPAELHHQNHKHHHRQYPSHVFKEWSLITLLIISIFSSYLIRPGNGLHPPQCQWSLHQDIERLNCLVETGSSLIVEEEVHGIGPEHAKSLWVQCNSGGGGDSPPSTISGSSSTSSSEYNTGGNNDNNMRTDFYNSPSTSALGTEGVLVQHSLSNSDSNANSRGFVLSHGVFMSVPNLRDLTLQSCKISGITPGALSYLPYLQNLTIRAHTSLTSWPSSSPLEIKPGVLRGLPELRHLDLSTTSLSSLPNDMLCFLPSLQYLNLSNCFLRDFRSIGIAPSDPTNPHNCGNQIRVLDLSHNYVSLLPPGSFMAVSKLEELRIEKNSITIAAERALLGLTNLRILSLAGNQLSSLPPEFFKDNRQIQEIYLQNNSLSVLAPGLFAGLKHLVVLDLSNNELTSEWVNGETFRGLDNLFALNLANNELSKIDSVLFRDLRFVQMLNLENNRIAHIAEDAFTGMPNMYTLVLSHNYLKSVDSFICNGLHGLSFLSMDNNKIENVEDDSFRNCSGLQDLNLSGNKMTRVPESLRALTHLRTLDLGENNITDVGNASYQALPNLYGLRLTDNNINFIPKNSFASLPALKIVNLAKNNISKVEAGVFDMNQNLQAVRLDSNKISEISGLFKNIPNLLWLNISANELTTLKYEEFPQRLQWLDVRSNKIHTLGNCMELENLRIRNLDLSENLITEVGSSNIPDSIENLILQSNLISQIQPYTFYRKPNLTRVDISRNKLVRLDQNALRLGPDRASSLAPQAEVFMGNNPFECDCSMAWLQEMDSDDTAGQYPVIQDVGDVKCTLSFGRTYEPISYLSVPPSQFLCKYESHCFKTCQCCEYQACDCQMTCPKNNNNNSCSCYHDQAWITNVVDCSMLEQTFIPGQIPIDVTELYLDGNVFNTLDSHAFIGRKNLRALYLNASHIEGIQNRTFHGLKALRTLHLENNFIERLDGYEFEDLENLEELYLHQNSILFIANETFSRLYRLRTLWLHDNNLVDLNIWTVTTRIGRLSYTLQDLTVSGNEWSCECEFATQLKDWLVENRGKISDASQVHCVDQVSTSSSTALSSSDSSSSSSSSSSQFSGSGGSVSSGGGGSNTGQRQQSKSQTTELVVVRLLDQKNHRCSSSTPSESTDLSILEPTKSTDSDDFNLTKYKIGLIIIAGVIIILALLCGLCYYWRQFLRVWFHSHCGLRLGSCREPPAERDKLFDAFISYSSKDEAWVRQVLAAELERNDPPYRLCLRYRDLPTGGTYLADTIVQASEASRRTILVLSHHFLKGEWSRTDVKSAHHSVLKDRHRKVIIILLGDLPSKDLDPDIRLYLKNHTYLNCEDKQFWEKLRYALPDVKVKAPVFRGIQGRNSTTRNSSSQHRSSGSAGGPTSSGPPTLQPLHHHHHPGSHQNHHNNHHHHHYSQPSPNLSQAHHLTHLGPNTQNNITSPLIGPPPPQLSAPPPPHVPGLLANLPPNIPNGTLGQYPHHATTTLHSGGGPVTTMIGGGAIGVSMASLSNSSNNSGSQRAPQRHHSLVNSHSSVNSKQNNAVHI